MYPTCVSSKLCEFIHSVHESQSQVKVDEIDGNWRTRSSSEVSLCSQGSPVPAYHCWVPLFRYQHVLDIWVAMCQEQGSYYQLQQMICGNIFFALGCISRLPRHRFWWDHHLEIGRRPILLHIVSLYFYISPPPYQHFVMKSQPGTWVSQNSQLFLEIWRSSNFFAGCLSVGIHLARACGIEDFLVKFCH